MAYLSFIAVVVALAISVILHLFPKKKQALLPTGVQTLPGPKGQASRTYHYRSQTLTEARISNSRKRTRRTGQEQLLEVPLLGRAIWRDISM